MLRHLETSEDIAWVFNAHLKAFKALNAPPADNPLHRPFVAVLLFGNEDAPEEIELYSVNRNDAPVLRFVPDSDGNYYLQGIR